MQATYKIVKYYATSLPPSYRNLIFSKWLRSLRYGNDYFKLIQQDIYFKAYQLYLESILNNPNTIISLAVLSDDEDVVLGFSIITHSTLHYVYVQKEQRKQGIGTSLTPLSQLTTISHLTKIGLSLWNNKCPHLIFNPF